VGRDKRFTGDDLIDVEVTRDIARLRRVRRGAKESQSAKRKQQSDDLSRGPSKAMSRKAARKGPTHRLAPEDAPAEAVERIAGRRAVAIAPGDVVVSREPIPNVNANPLTRETQWRFRVCIEGTVGSSQFFTNFTHAASRGEQLATVRRARLVFVEDDIPSLLADYRG